MSSHNKPELQRAFGVFSVFTILLKVYFSSLIFMEHFGEPQISIAACNHSMEGGANHERRSLITAHHLDNNCCSEVWQKKHWASWHTTRKRREVLSACARAAGLLIASMCTPRSKHIQQHSEISFAIEYLTWQGKERQKLPRSKRREVHNLSINNTAHTRHTHTHTRRHIICRAVFLMHFL